ncbi:PIN domain-containing protein [Fibrobacter sp. UBA4297]|jgi:predicted nucleic acid-binding protein|uniref:type II toxin-antitoxin system VapC family toxin n=1 Tax=Fibrobacter sp. UBA4297 TaxID=1946536 RepID=UPI0025BB0DFD|nr:PIN domain-containing protein [Fibrobacter sp. UBA4297]
MVLTKLFVDTNIFANWLIADNTGHYESSLLIKSCLMGYVAGFVSSHSLTDLFYITRKHFSVEERRLFLQLILSRFNVVEESSDMFSAVLADPNCKDLEDGLQMECAARERVDFIVTENIKDFKFSRVKALSAKDALSMVS